MGIIIGIDIGTSAIKAAALKQDGTLVCCARLPLPEGKICADEITREFICQNSLNRDEITGIALTGIRLALTSDTICGYPAVCITEFEANGAGGLYLSGLDTAIIGCMGTGTSLVLAKNGSFSHVGGSAVGGGTLTGLCSRLFGMDDVPRIEALAEKGSLKKVDWSIAEVSGVVMPTLPDFATSSNLGKMAQDAEDADVALGIINMIFQTAGTLAVFACRNAGIDTVVMVGTLAQLETGKTFLGQVGLLYGIHFIVPENCAYAAAIGAAECLLSRQHPTESCCRSV